MGSTKTEHTLWRVVDAHLGWISFLIMSLLVASIWTLRFLRGNPVLFGEDIYNALVLFSSVTSTFSEMGIRIAILAVSIALTGFGISCLFYVVSHYIESVWMKRAIMGLVSITPGFLFASASFSKTLIVFVFSSFIWFCLTKMSENKYDASSTIQQKKAESRWWKVEKRGMYFVLALIFSFLLGFISPLAVTFLVLAWYVYLDPQHSHFYFIGMSIIGSICGYYLSFPLWYGLFSIPNIVSDFGAPQGVGVMVILLAVLSVLFWEKQWSTRSLLITVPLGILLLFDPSLMLLFYLVIIVLAARTWEELFFEGWALPLVRKMTLFVVVLSFIFSMLVFVERASLFSPTNEEHAALRVVAVYTPLSVSVFSDPTQAAYIRYYAQRNPVVRGEKDREYYEQTVNSAYMKDVIPLLEGKGVNVLYFSTEMLKKLPADQRLRFLLTNERFKMIYLGNTTQVWMFTSRE